MTLPDTSEADLIARCRGGDERAFGELVDRYKDLVFALVGRTAIDRNRIEDLAQEVFLRIHRGLPYFRGEARLSTWIYRIVLNLVAAERSSRDRTALSLDSDELPEAVLSSPSSRRAYTDIELRDSIDKALARLPAQARFLIAAHYFKGARYEDLADALGLPMGTVKTHLHRAKRLLRRILQEELG